MKKKKRKLAPKQVPKPPPTFGVQTTEFKEITTVLHDLLTTSPGWAANLFTDEVQRRTGYVGWMIGPVIVHHITVGNITQHLATGRIPVLQPAGPWRREYEEYVRTTRR